MDKIADGGVVAFDEQKRKSLSLAEMYAEPMKNIVSASHNHAAE